MQANRAIHAELYRSVARSAAYPDQRRALAKGQAFCREGRSCRRAERNFAHV